MDDATLRGFMSNGGRESEVDAYVIWRYSFPHFVVSVLLSDEHRFLEFLELANKSVVRVDEWSDIF